MTIDDYIKSLKQPLSGEETQKLFIAYKNGDINARQELIETNLRLVPYIIQRYYGNYVDSFEDYISVGNIALIKAIDNYDLSVGITFSTYASKSIINEITKYIIIILL